MDQLITLKEASKRIGTSNIPLLRGLIRLHDIPNQKVGRATAINAEGFRRLETALREWRDRPRLDYRPLQKSTATA